jgi:hypothetical protein
VIFLFIRSLFSHTLTYVGVVLLLAGAYSKISNKLLLLAPKWLLLAGMVCLSLGSFLAWRDEHKNTETVIAQRQQAEIEKNALQANLDESQRQLELLRKFEAEEPDKRARERAEIVRLIEAGNSLMQECLLKTRNDADLADQANRWEAETILALAGVDPSLAARFKTSVGTPHVHPPTNGANEVVWNFMNNRIQTLSTILHDLGN